MTRRAALAAVATATATLVATLAMVTATGGCERKKAEKAGIGRYHVGKLTLAKAPGRCDPTELPDGRKGMWCYAQPKLAVAGMNADVDLYFGSDQPTAPVIEIQLQIRACKEAELAHWLRNSFGAPLEERGPRMYWQLPVIYVVGELPSESGRCLVRVLPISEKAEFERLRAPPPPSGD